MFEFGKICYKIIHILQKSHDGGILRLNVCVTLPNSVLSPHSLAYRQKCIINHTSNLGQT